MSDINTGHFRELLLKQQQELMDAEQEAAETTRTVSLDQSSVGRLSRMDAMQSQQMALETKRRRKLQLTRIEAALDRIDEDEYGYCAMCDEEINQRRLEADPANPFCVTCAESM
ncbi:TraR/DksA C4-type zinc finger protein [Desulfopila sp. IMCC35008]|uniref:TraR/DksA family transcriptional regulator n=1 Tax=Desulfopila sp. IMCC35008 TaxID=2653858 RepID=UPI0013D57E34|nr:TraR/DksA C4-type zinc finger protein [Desulfopila sp. IMCC35008]